LKATGVAEAFQAWSRRSGLPIPFQGAHCLRHSYGIYLLRRGASIKAIGDLLGHRWQAAEGLFYRQSTTTLGWSWHSGKR
jgi:site-specific recombinase XerD